jgi:hypothetical protein
MQSAFAWAAITLPPRAFHARFDAFEQGFEGHALTEHPESDCLSSLHRLSMAS